MPAMTGTPLQYTGAADPGSQVTVLTDNRAVTINRVRAFQIN